MEEYIDEYKHLEKLCNEIFGCQHGVTQYITEMENTPRKNAMTVPGWSSNLNDLKRLRHIRNSLVHDTDGIDYSADDVELVKEFYEKIMNQQDPLSLIRVKEESKTEYTPKPEESKREYIPKPAPKISIAVDKSLLPKPEEEDEDNLTFGQAVAVFMTTIIVTLAVLTMGFIYFS